MAKLKICHLVDIALVLIRSLVEKEKKIKK